MKTLLRVTALTVMSLLMVTLAGNVRAVGQCILNCPLGDGGVVGPGGGNKSPDLDGSGAVDIADLAALALAWPPNPYDFCVDFNCDGVINIADLALFAPHWLHAGPVRGFCQPDGNHYKTYETAGPLIDGPITLDDQFGVTTHSPLIMTKIATPVEKNGQPMCDPIAHQTWWEFVHPEPQRLIRAKDQFGEFDWFLGDSRFLLAPALKNEPTGLPLPEWNHYKCYEAQGPTFALDVVLRDQFGVETAIVLFGKLFCNPAKKTIPDGTTFEIVDPISHLTCYQVDNPLPHGFTVVVRDQFVETPVVLRDNQCLCLPAQKTAVFLPTSSEWRKIKALFDE